MADGAVDNGHPVPSTVVTGDNLFRIADLVETDFFNCTRPCAGPIE